MQAIAREFNYSETTFVLPPHQAKAAWRIEVRVKGDRIEVAGRSVIVAEGALFL